MNILEIEQNSPEWFAARCGIPTASEFDQLIDASGAPSKSRERYLYKVAGEAITKIPAETFQSFAMKRGSEMQEEARALYEVIYDCRVEKVGLCYHGNEKKIACSPDGLVGKKGALEVKCPIISTHVKYLLNKDLLLKDYFQQVQGQLFVTGLAWVDLISYYPGLKPLIIRVMPDGKFQIALKAELLKFCAEVEQIVEKIK